ncbi:MAG: hypothetical protein ACI4XF_05710 [Oscillospiraceae bacterium]
MAKSNKTAANEIAKETTAVEAAAEITAAAEKPVVTEEKAPAKKTAKAKTAEAPVSEPVPEAQPVKKRNCGRKPAAKKADQSSAAEVNPEEKPAAKRTRKTKAAVPEQSDFDKFVSDVKKKTEKAKAPADFAAQVAITGKVDGIFYVKAENGSAYAAGYNYVGADLYVTADSETFADLMSGKTDFDSAVLGGKITFEDAPLSTVIAFKKVVF